MAKVYPAIDDDLRAFLGAPPLFFVATAPSGDDGHVNCSPKGGHPLAVLGPLTVAYLDLVGSGVETIAHLRQNGRIVIMVCAFQGPPRIVRLHGRGRAVEPDAPEFAALMAHWPGSTLGVRSIIVVDVTRISDSCGFGVPRMHYEGERDQLARWRQARGEQGIRDYVRQKNAQSLDGLPAVDRRDDAR